MADINGDMIFEYFGAMCEGGELIYTNYPDGIAYVKDGNMAYTGPDASYNGKKSKVTTIYWWVINFKVSRKISS